MNRMDLTGRVLYFALLLSGSLACTPRQDDRPRLVLLVSVDTMRADRLFCGKAAGCPTPHLNRLADDGILFSNAVAHSPWTIPSHASLLTSLYPTVTLADARTALPPEAVTLAEVLREHGYVSGAVVNTTYLGKKFGFDQGFDEFDEAILHKGAAQVIDRTLSFLERHATGRLFFFLHLFDAHGPYGPLDEGAVAADGPQALPDAAISFLRRVHYHDYLGLGRYQSLTALKADYDAGIKRVDAELGRLFEEMKSRGVYDDAVILVTSDHGEEFFEHGVYVGHGLFLYDTELRVPLILKLPRTSGLSGVTVDDPVGLVDILPTIVDAVGLPPVEGAQGRSLLTLISPSDEPPPENSKVVFGSSSNLGDTMFVRNDRWKYIAALEAEPAEIVKAHLRPDEELAQTLTNRILPDAQLYDLVADPDETVNVAKDRPEVVEHMEALLEKQRRANSIHRARYLQGESDGVQLTEEERERLRSLGYVR